MLSNGGIFAKRAQQCAQISAIRTGTFSFTERVMDVQVNGFHEQLVLSAGGDGMLVLHSAVKVENEEDGEMSIEQVCQYSEPHHMVASRFDDALYKCEWSRLDPWRMAAASWDGKIRVLQVPQQEKYNAIL